jgi:hypothetical protein
MIAVATANPTRLDKVTFPQKIGISRKRSLNDLRGIPNWQGKTEKLEIFFDPFR